MSNGIKLSNVLDCCGKKSPMEMLGVECTEVVPSCTEDRLWVRGTCVE